MTVAAGWSKETSHSFVTTSFRCAFDLTVSTKIPPTRANIPTRQRNLILVDIEIGCKV
ncbi:MAG: hypothetical protein LBU27_04415 [Candidatus Peribacteria bacterium]|nr:hypothetical protein [Candidatus Peribacteria bacterium]